MTQATIEFASETVRDRTLALDAVEQFHVALNRMFAGDLEPMKTLWSRRPDVALLCPGGGREVGFKSILENLERNKEAVRGGTVVPRDILTHVYGDVAYSTMIEQGEVTAATGQKMPLELRATSVFGREEGEWRLIYHHTDPAPPMQAAAAAVKPPVFEPSLTPQDPEILKELERGCRAIGEMFLGKTASVINLWEETDEVSFGGPDGNWKIGFEKVREQFLYYSDKEIRGTPTFKDPLIRILGDLALASYLETVPDLTLAGRVVPYQARATTILVRAGHRWLQVHQHSDLTPGVVEYFKHCRS